MTDYKALLRKYMTHVLDEEGITFVDTFGAPVCGRPSQDPDDVQALEEIEREVLRDR